MEKEKEKDLEKETKKVSEKEPEVKETKKKKTKTKNNKIKELLIKNKKIALIVLIALIAVIGIIVLISILASSGSKEYPILLIENEQLVMWRKGEEEKKVVVKEFKEKYLYTSYANNTINEIAYLEDDSLYIYNVKEEKSEKIAANVEDFEFSSKDNHIVYTTTEDKIYAYNFKDKNKIKLGEGDSVYFKILEDNKVFYRITTEDEDDDDKSEKKYYIKDLNSDKSATKIQSLDSYNYYFNDDETKILYYSTSKDGNLYIYDIKENKATKLVSGTTSIESFDSVNFENIIYTTTAEKAPTILEDDEKDADPVITYQDECQYSDYKAGLCTWDQYWDDVVITKQKSKKEENDKIREAAEEVEFYDVYQYKNGKKTKLVSNVTNVYGSNQDSAALVYEQYEIAEPVKISTLTEKSDFNKFIEGLEKVYILQNNKTVMLKDITSKEIDSVAISPKGDAYILNKKNELYHVKGNNKLTLINESVSYVMLSKYNEMLYSIKNEDDETEDLLKVVGTESTDIAEAISQIVEYKEDGIYLLNNCNEEETSCDLSYYNGELTFITDDVYSAKMIDDKNFYVFKNYSSKADTYDLYRYENGKQIQVGFDIPEFGTSVESLK